MKVFEALGRAFAAETTTAFGLLGDGNMFAMSAYAGVPGTHLVQGRHENAVVAMADGYARMSGEVGLCTVIDGPGITQVPTSLVIAAGRHTPLVLFVGDAPISAGYNIHAYGQEALARASRAEFIHVGTSGRALSACREAFTIARTRRCPVVLSVPADVQDEELEWAFDYESSHDVVPPPQPILPLDELLLALIEQLANAERPVIIAGEGAVKSGAHDDIAALAAKVGALTSTSIRAKGLFRDSPHYLGVVGAFASGAARELLVEADLVVGIGAALGYYTTEGGYLFPTAQRVQIDIDPVGLHTGQYVADTYIRGDAKATVARLLELLGDRPAVTGYRTEAAAATIAGARDRLMDECRPSPGGGDGVHPMAAMMKLDEALTDDTCVVFGVGHSWAFPLMGMGNIGAERLMVLDDFGVIGQSLPTAIGAAVARPDLRVLCIDGDGSFIMNIQELETAVREHVNLAILVVNDGAYGAEVHKLDAKGLDGRLTHFGRPNFVGVLEAFGGHGETVSDLEDLKRAGDALVNGDGVRMLDLWTDGGVASPVYNRLYFGGGH